MITILRFFLFCTVCFSFLPVSAQNHRRTLQKSVPYRATYQRISAQGNAWHLLELRDGTLWAWGLNDQGQLGDGTSTNRLTPVQIGNDNHWVNVSVGGRHSVALKSDGTLWTWGDNLFGQLGNGTTTDNQTPTQVGTDNKWIGISAGGWFTLAIKTDGTLWAWGENSHGELGDGTTLQRLVPTQIGAGTTWTKIATGEYQSYALKANGTLWSWGENQYGMLGLGNTTDQSAPTQIGSDNIWVSFGSGQNHFVAIKADGTLWACGYNQDGQVGNGTSIQQNTMVQIGTDTKWVTVSPGDNHTLALKANGTLWAWGDNTYGALGNGTTTDALAPVQIGTDNHWVSVSGGQAESFALKANGSLWGTGRNLFGSLGIANTIQQNSFIQTSITLNVWLTISSGAYHNLSLKTNGRMLSWGSNQYGQTLNQFSVSYLYVQYSGTDNDWISVATGHQHSLGIKSDGTLWCWGGNFYGALGIGTADGGVFRNVPIQIGTDNSWVSISASGYNSMGLKADGTIWTWGRNQFGQIGNGTTTDQYTPVQVGTLHTWVSIGAGQFSTFALKADGTRWGWGFNTNNQLGDGTTTARTTPVQTGTNNDWISAQGGPGFHTVGLKANGTLWAWGFNNNGQLGNNTIVDNTNILQVGTDNKWLEYAPGYQHTMARKTDGTVWGWGDNTSGNLGDGTTTDRLLPLQIGVVNNWIRIITGDNHSVAMKALRDGFCATGQNNTGQIGDNTSIQRNSFTCYIEGCAAPAAPSAAPVSTCNGSSASLNATGAGIVGWYTAATGGTYLGGGATYITNPLTTDTVFYAQDSTCAVSTARVAVVVTVNALPAVTANASSQSVCAGGTATLTGGGASSYVWDNGATNGVAFNPASTTTYTVTGTSGNSCSNTASVTVTVNPLPTVTANASAPTICAGNPETLSGGGATSYVWDNGVTNGFAFNPASTTTYTVTGTNGNSCSNTASVTVTVNPLPTVTANASAPTICAGNPETLSGGGAISYVWDNGVTNGVAFNPASTTTYTVTGTNGNSCSNTASVTVTVNPLPTVTANASAPTICAGNPETLSGGGATSYVWDNGVTNGVAFNPSSTTIYTVTGTNGNSCSNTASVTVTVNPLPTVTANASAPTICAGNPETLSGGGATSYVWDNGVTNGVAFNPSSTTIYTVTGTNGNSCSNTASVTITVNPLPLVTLDLSAMDTVCQNAGIVTLTGASPAGGTFSGTGVTGNSFNPVTSGLGTFTITYSFTDVNNCMNADSGTIFVDVCLGINESANGFSFSVYPNPTSGQFTITLSTENAEISVFDVLGNQILKTQATEKTTRLQLENAGLYFVCIKTAQGTAVRKLVVNR